MIVLKQSDTEPEEEVTGISSQIWVKLNNYVSYPVKIKACQKIENRVRFQVSDGILIPIRTHNIKRNLS
jgi:hypothetical protein